MKCRIYIFCTKAHHNGYTLVEYVCLYRAISMDTPSVAGPKRSDGMLAKERTRTRPDVAESTSVPRTTSSI